MYSPVDDKDRPLTNSMTECLIDCHERELMKMFPCRANEIGAKGLIGRGLLRAEFVIDAAGKQMMCVFLTAKGRRYLSDEL